jgi:ABC-type nitrate/sulfonate/bicarbonate transport system permease component
MSSALSVPPTVTPETAAPRSTMSEKSVLGRINVLGLITGASLIGIWELLVDTGVLTYTYLPSPSQIWGGAVAISSSGELWPNLAHTVWITLAGWAGAIVTGLLLGLLLGLSNAAWRYSMATVEVLRALPTIAFVPVAILILGFSARMELVITIYVAQWPILINTIDGVRGVQPGLLDVATMMRISRFDRIRKFILPAALPLIVVGLRLSLTLSLVLAVVAEMVGNPTGLGYQLVFQQQALRPDRMFAYVLIIGIIGVLLNGLFTTLARLLPGTSRTGGKLS